MMKFVEASVGVGRWYHSYRKSNAAVNVVSQSVYDLPVPSNLTLKWNFGSLLGCCLVVQLVTGLLMATHYTPSVEDGFDSVVKIMTDVTGGWLLRAAHANGATFFFFFIYCHVGRGLYYYSFALTKTWIVGVHMLLLLMAVAFTGYVLPWGQMSYWAATVITNLVTAFPVIGHSLVELIWGGSSVCDATLKRFFVFHFIAPFGLLVLTAVHLIYLHEDGASNPLGLEASGDNVPFHPYFTIKDLFGAVVFVGFLAIIVLWTPDVFLDPENFIPADPMKTPVHIQPEWYFLFAYTILRGVPNKLGGVILLVLSVVGLYFMPFLPRPSVKGVRFNSAGVVLFWVFVADFIALTCLGRCTVDWPYSALALLCTAYYFFYVFLSSSISVLWEDISFGAAKRGAGVVVV
uniref:cytochrome b n=1 Tax=Kuphus polythalamius TaxID=1049060 RepID=UPI002027E31A|nr:cytochrome b [Kuphus polythalamius]UPX89199.1 cytochrome b [Kuphus polythalamius]